MSPDAAAFAADLAALAWQMEAGADEAIGETPVDHLVWNDTPDLPIEGQTFATAYICRAIIPEVTLIAPDGSPTGVLRDPRDAPDGAELRLSLAGGKLHAISQGS